ncbi:MAG: hypothetical protein RQ732_00200 [Methylophaga sp.]|nr:hypothetical protein [Methylophaga sp.]
MLFIKHSVAIALSVVTSFLLLLSPLPVVADLSMKPRTCSNCSSFGSQSSLYHHRPSIGISGHQSFGNQPFKSQRPKNYNNFKHSGHRNDHHDKPHYRDYRPRFDGYQQALSTALPASQWH